jgi:hypothetical protein
LGLVPLKKTKFSLLYSFKQSSLCFYMRTERVVGWINKFELPKIHTPVKIAKHQIKRSSTKCYIKEHTNTMMKTNKGKKKIEMTNNILNISHFLVIQLLLYTMLFIIHCEFMIIQFGFLLTIMYNDINRNIFSFRFHF